VNKEILAIAQNIEKTPPSTTGLKWHAGIDR
jgi:hypothetical protein